MCVYIYNNNLKLMLCHMNTQLKQNTSAPKKIETKLMSLFEAQTIPNQNKGSCLFKPN